MEFPEKLATLRKKQGLSQQKLADMIGVDPDDIRALEFAYGDSLLNEVRTEQLNLLLSLEEKKGLKTFINVGCLTCHTGSQLGGNMLQKFGVYDNYWNMTGSDPVDEGRFKETGNEADKYMFKVPTLRNVAMTYPYFHDGSVEKLEDAVKIIAKVNLNKDLTEEETRSIVIFLNTLTGDLPEEVKKIPEELNPAS